MNKNILKIMSLEEVQKNIMVNSKIIRRYIKHYNKIHFFKLTLNKNIMLFSKKNIENLSKILQSYSVLNEEEIKKRLDDKIFYEENIKEKLMLNDLKIIKKKEYGFKH
jgi:hypothetical protein